MLIKKTVIIPIAISCVIKVVQFYTSNKGIHGVFLILFLGFYLCLPYYQIKCLIIYPSNIKKIVKTLIPVIVIVCTMALIYWNIGRESFLHFDGIVTLMYLMVLFLSVFFYIILLAIALLRKLI